MPFSGWPTEDGYTGQPTEDGLYTGRPTDGYTDQSTEDGYTDQPTDGYTGGADGNYYKFYSERLAWDAARDACAKEGAFLAMEKTNATHNYIVQTYGDPMWIGVTDMVQIGWRERERERKREKERERERERERK